jgi:peptidoglycan/LPS O-acetylase OafA/YrhL
MRVSIDERLLQANGRPSGFDYLRLALATAVFLLHIPLIDFGDAAANKLWLPWLRPVSAIVLPMFFALSGFLVAGSLVRARTLISFIGLRIVRIVPALTVEVLLSALILGPLFTTMRLSQYFSSRGFFIYFLNAVGDVHYHLPGVFADNPYPNIVNGQLWTVPLELRCYVLLAVIALLGIFRNSLILVSAIIIICAAVLCRDLMFPPEVWVTVHGAILVEAFVVGVALFRLKKKIPHSAGLFVLSSLATIALLALPYGDYFVAAPATYVTVYCGLLNPDRNKLLLSGDYSYGIYLYGFPIQQAIAAAAPSLRSVAVSLVVALPLTVVCAMASWWLIERPALSRRRTWLPAVEAYLLNRAGPGAARLLQPIGQSPGELSPHGKV